MVKITKISITVAAVFAALSLFVGVSSCGDGEDNFGQYNSPDPTKSFYEEISDDDSVKPTAIKIIFSSSPSQIFTTENKIYFETNTEQSVLVKYTLFYTNDGELPNFKYDEKKIDSRKEAIEKTSLSDIISGSDNIVKTIESQVTYTTQIEDKVLTCKSSNATDSKARLSSE